MVNYACAFSQSESGKYFEWILLEFINYACPWFWGFKLDIKNSKMPESSLNDKDGYFSHRKATDVGEIDTDVEPP